ncbi:MAG: multidrug efflux SMR transporter [Lentisphaeraceae bacterium]|nr:multidrug efflux SMR transporter [Lentisphaeraceae bacterium]
MNWLILFLAGLFEIMWAVGLKYSHGFTKLWPSVFTAVTMVLSFVFLGIALKTIHLGTAYAVWVGIGIVGTTVLSYYLFSEQFSLLKAVSVAFICLGVIGLKLGK